MKFSALFFGIFVFTTPLFSQVMPTDGKREEVRDTDGRLTTFIYSADETRVVRVEDDEVIVTPRYAANGEEVGIAVHVRGCALTLAVAYDGNRRLSVDGLPEIVRSSTEQGRHSTIRTSSGDAIATYHYRAGYVREVRLDRRFALKLSLPEDGRVTQTLRGARGEVLRETVVPGRDGRVVTPLSLDIVARELGLTEDWARMVRVKTSASNFLTTVANETGEPLVYFVHVGSDRVAFRSNGKPLLYDLWVDIGKHVDGSGGDVIDDPPSTDLESVVPNRIVVSHAGMTGAYISHASEGAITSFWTERDRKGRIVTRHRSVQRPPVSPAVSPTSDETVAPPAWRVVTPATCRGTYDERVCTFLGDHEDGDGSLRLLAAGHRFHGTSSIPARLFANRAATNR